jgi:hypothetical protein
MFVLGRAPNVRLGLMAISTGLAANERRRTGSVIAVEQGGWSALSQNNERKAAKGNRHGGARRCKRWPKIPPTADSLTILRRSYALVAWLFASSLMCRSLARRWVRSLAGQQQRSF